jgi:hypothetical protein
MSVQPETGQPVHMERPDEIDRALQTAVEHVEEAQVGLIDEPLGSSRSVEFASKVVHRVEDVDVLATEARAATEAAAGEAADQGRNLSDGA